MSDGLEEKLGAKLGESLEECIEKKVSSFGGLLTRRAAVFLLCKENGIETERKIMLGEAEGTSLPFAFTAVVERIFPVQKYASSNDKSVRLHVSDKSGAATLVLWNDQAQLAEGGVSAGDTIECHGAYFKNGEIGIGKQGSIKAIIRTPVASVSKLTHGVCSVEGAVGEVEPDLEYVDKKTGANRRMSSFQLCEENPEGTHCRRVVVWSSPEGMEPPEVGDILLLENVLFRSGEIHFNSYSRAVKKKSSADISGTLESMAVDGEDAVLTLGGREFRLGAGEALALLGIRSVPQGVHPSTLLSIKAGELSGRRAVYRLSGGKLSSISFPTEKKA